MASLDPWLEVSVAERRDDWARVVCSNGWSAWVDGRVLVPLSGAVEPAPTALTYRVAFEEATAAGPIRVADASVASTGRRDQGGKVAAAAGVLVATSALLPWIRSPGRSADAFDVPIEFLLSYDSTSRIGLEVGFVTVVLGVLGAVAALVRPAGRWRRLIGFTVVVVATLYVFQLQRLLGVTPAARRPSLLSRIGFGVYLTLVAGLVLALAPAEESDARSEGP